MVGFCAYIAWRHFFGKKKDIMNMIDEVIDESREGRG